MSAIYSYPNKEMEYKKYEGDSRDKYEELNKVINTFPIISSNIGYLCKKEIAENETNKKHIFDLGCEVETLKTTVNVQSNEIKNLKTTVIVQENEIKNLKTTVIVQENEIKNLKTTANRQEEAKKYGIEICKFSETFKPIISNSYDILFGNKTIKKGEDNSEFWLCYHIKEVISGRISTLKIKNQLQLWNNIVKTADDLLKKKLAISLDCWIILIDLQEKRNAMCHLQEEEDKTISEDELISLLGKTNALMLRNSLKKIYE